MKKIYTLLTLLFTFSLSFAQNGNPSDGSYAVGEAPQFGIQNKAMGDSCGTYFNNYIGLAKTSAVFYESMRIGNGGEFGTYSGRAQRFTANQAIEVSGVEFYAFKNMTAMDSIMVITYLYSYDVPNDSVGAELARDTVYVKHLAFDFVLPNIAVQSYFDTPITMTTDYIIAVETPTDDSLKIVTSSIPANDGAGANLSHALYNNPIFPSFGGWWNNLNDFSLDYDYLLNPYVKFELQNGFTVLDDSICPGTVGAGCVDYIPVANFSDPMYTGNSGTPNSYIVWLWGDGFQNTDITSACHTYSNPGTYTINLIDTLTRWDFNSPFCTVNLTADIFVEDSVFANFTNTSAGLTSNFTNTSTNADSVWWDFGDATAGENTDSPTHVYATIGTYDVWLYAYNDCFVDSIMYQVIIDDVGIEANENKLNIYPNPANNNVLITGIENGSRVELLNILGEVIYTFDASNEKETIDVSSFAVGSYFVKITTSEKQISKKLIIKH